MNRAGATRFLPGRTGRPGTIGTRTSSHVRLRLTHLRALLQAHGARSASRGPSNPSDRLSGARSAMCPLCGCPGVLLGGTGHRRWYRCSGCDMTYAMRNA